MTTTHTTRHSNLSHGTGWFLHLRNDATSNFHTARPTLLHNRDMHYAACSTLCVGHSAAACCSIMNRHFYVRPQRKFAEMASVEATVAVR